MHLLTPISKVMGISVVSYDRESLTVAAPLAPNINPHQSASGKVSPRSRHSQDGA